MELIFNELSAPANCVSKYDANDKMIKFAEAVNTASKHGFRNIRSHLYSHEIMLSSDYSVHNWIFDKDASKDHKDFLLGKFVYPFIKEGDTEIEKHYVDANYYFESPEDKINRVECVGFASAYLYETLSISLPSLSIWDKPKHSLIIEIGGHESTAEVFNIVSKESLGNHEISSFVDSIRDVVLIETSILPEDKERHIYGYHHGNKERRELWDKIKNDPYVIAMRSTGGYGTGRFIRSVKKDGIIEVVIDGRYSVCVQTTGTNRRETKAIADILDERYS